MIILTLTRRESPWFSLYQRENLLDEAKLVDVRLRRNERTQRKELFGLGVEKATSSDCKTVSLPRLCNNIVRRPWKGAQTSSSPANQTRSKVQNAATKAVCRVHQMRDRGQRRDDDAQCLSQNATDLKEHVQHTSWTCQWACASRIPSGPIQTKPVFNCVFSLYPPPPPTSRPQPPVGCAWPLKLNEGGHVLGVNHRERDHPFTTTVDLQALDAKSATFSNGQCTFFFCCYALPRPLATIWECAAPSAVYKAPSQRRTRTRGFTRIQVCRVRKGLKNYLRSTEHA